MIFPGFDTYKNGKLKICPRCANEETDDEGTYCKICGVPLINHCDKSYWEDDRYEPAYGEKAPCGQILPSNARYCIKCGHTSTFLNSELLEDWKAFKHKSEQVQNHHADKAEGFMNIPPGTDEETLFK